MKIFGWKLEGKGGRGHRIDELLIRRYLLLYYLTP